MNEGIKIIIEGKTGVGKTQAMSVIREAFFAFGISIEVVNPEGLCPDARDSAMNLKDRNVAITIVEKQLPNNS